MKHPTDPKPKVQTPADDVDGREAVGVVVWIAVAVPVAAAVGIWAMVWFLT